MMVFFALGNAKVLSFALGDAKVPNANGFASQWSKGFNYSYILYIFGDNQVTHTQYPEPGSFHDIILCISFLTLYF